MRILRQNRLLYDSGDYQKDESGITIRIRGNSSAYVDKKPYKLHLSKKADLLLRGNDEKYKDKDWLLVKDEESYTNNNEMSLRSLVGFKMSEIMGMDYTPSCKYVNLVVNNQYRGIYLLVESVKRNQKCRVNVSDTGFIVEFDPYWWNEDVWFETPLTSVNDWYKYTFKYPDDDITSSQIAYIKDYITTVEESLERGDYPDYIDVESFAKWLLFFHILGCNDSGGTNMFFTKYDNTCDTKLKIGPVWDFDGIMREYGSPRNKFNNLYAGLLNSQNRVFFNTFKQLYYQKGSEYIMILLDFLESFMESEDAKGLDKSRLFEEELWGDASSPETVKENVDYIKKWLEERITWLDYVMELDDGVWLSFK